MTKLAEPSTPSGSVENSTTKATDHALQKYDNFTRYGQTRFIVYPCLFIDVLLVPERSPTSENFIQGTRIFGTWIFPLGPAFRRFPPFTHLIAPYRITGKEDFP